VEGSYICRNRTTPARLTTDVKRDDNGMIMMLHHVRRDVHVQVVKYLISDVRLYEPARCLRSSTEDLLRTDRSRTVWIACFQTCRQQCMAQSIPSLIVLLFNTGNQFRI